MAHEVVLDSYIGSTSAEQQLYGASASIRSGQSFTPSKSVPVIAFELNIRRVGNPSGNVSFVLATHSGTYGTSSVAGTTLDGGTVAASSIPTSIGLVRFTLPAPVNVTAGTRYTIYIGYSGGDGSNYIGVNANVGANPNPAHPGNTFIYGSFGGSPAYTAFPTVDTPFRVIGDDNTDIVVSNMSTASLLSESDVFEPTPPIVQGAFYGGWGGMIYAATPYGQGSGLATYDTDLVISNISTGSSLQTAALVQNYTLSISNLTTNTSLGSLSLVQAYTLAISDLSTNVILDDVPVSSEGYVVPANLHTNTLLDTVSLVQHYVLSIEDLNTSSSLDDVTIAIEAILEIQDLKTLSNLLTISWPILPYIGKYPSQGLLDEKFKNDGVIFLQNGSYGEYTEEETESGILLPKYKQTGTL